MPRSPSTLSGSLILLHALPRSDMNAAYDPRLVLLSILISLLTAYAALDLANSVTAARGKVRTAWLWGGALAMGAGICGLHLVGTLAVSIREAPTTHNLLLLAVAFGIAVLASAATLWLISGERVRRVASIGSTVLFGTAFVGVHYLTVWSMRTPARVEWNAALEVASVALALGAAALTTWLGLRYRLERRREGRAQRMAGGLLVGLTFAATHYVGMAAVDRDPLASAVGVAEQEVFASPGLAFAAAAGTLLILIIALIGSVVGRELARRKDLADDNLRLYQEAKTELERRRRAELAQQESEERFRLLVTSVREYAIFLLDTEGRVMSWNEGAERINGYAPEEILGRHFSTFYTEEDRERAHPDAELEIAERSGVYKEEGWRVRRDGSQFWAHVTITAIRDSTGQLIGFAKVTRDLTERKRAEEERELLLERERAARMAAEEANRVKADFLAAMGHELRTPLNHIIGYADLLLAGTPEPLPHALRRSVERIGASARHLLHLIEEIFTFSRLDSTGEQVEHVAVDLVEIVREAGEAADPQARERGLELSVCTPQGDCEIRTDPRLLRAVLENLLENAVAFTPEGRVELALTCDPESAKIEVRDTGVGIAADLHERIFDPFFQVDSGNTRAVGGTGMGLAVAKRSARLLGGDITLDSAPGQGSTFTFLLPASPD